MSTCSNGSRHKWEWVANRVKSRKQDGVIVQYTMVGEYRCQTCTAEKYDIPNLLPSAPSLLALLRHDEMQKMKKTT